MKPIQILFKQTVCEIKTIRQENEIPNDKTQIPNKFQITMNQIQNVWGIDDWDLDIVCYL